MAAFSSSYGVPRAVNKQKEVSLRKLCNRKLDLNCSRFRISLKQATFHAFSVKNSCRYRGLQVVNMSQTPGDLEAGVTATEILKQASDDSVLEKNLRILNSGKDIQADNDGDIFNGSNGNRNGNGKHTSGGGGGGGGDDDDDGGNGENDGNDEEEEEFGPVMNYEEVLREIKARGASLPSDMLEAAKSVGIRRVLLLRYLDLQGSVWPIGFTVKSFSMLRNRMLADPSFLFKVGTEIVIDSCCATLAEVQKRGKDFWAEFELYVADLLVGLVVNVALVSMLAPYARIGQPSISKGFLGKMKHAYSSLPSSVFEAERPGCSFSVKQRMGTYFFKGLLYGSVGFACGIIGQGIANLIMTAKRNIKKSEEDIPVPPLIKSAALWGVFLAVSSNTRYQIVNGLERLVEGSRFAQQVPPAALAFTVGIRFANNVYGGMQFVDWARWSGVQ